MRLRIIASCATALSSVSVLAAAQPTSQPRLTLMDSVRVIEIDRLDVGKPNAIAVAPDGAVFISDVSARRVLRADRKGVLAIVAPHGGEPGEFGVFEVSNTMYRWRLGTRLDTDSIILTVTARRGAKPAVIERLLREPTKAAELAFTWSAPLGVAPLSAERTAAVFYDPTLQGTTFTGPSFLQIVDWRSHRSCGEIRLPVPTDVVPRFVLRDDMLVAIVQHSDDGAVWILRWKISAGRC